MIGKSTTRESMLILLSGIFSVIFFVLSTLFFSMDLISDFFSSLACLLIIAAAVCGMSPLVVLLSCKMNKKPINKSLIVGVCFGLLTTGLLMYATISTIVYAVRPPMYNIGHDHDRELEGPCSMDPDNRCNEIDGPNER